MEHVNTHRRLVKSPPELWAELSDAEALARRLEELGEVRITRTLPESVVAWEAERASGVIEIEGSGWGTRVSLSAAPAPRARPDPGQHPAPGATGRARARARRPGRRPPPPVLAGLNRGAGRLPRPMTQRAHAPRTYEQKLTQLQELRDQALHSAPEAVA